MVLWRSGTTGDPDDNVRAQHKVMCDKWKRFLKASNAAKEDYRWRFLRNLKKAKGLSRATGKLLGVAGFIPLIPDVLDMIRFVRDARASGRTMMEEYQHERAIQLGFPESKLIPGDSYSRDSSSYC